MLTSETAPRSSSSGGRSVDESHDACLEIALKMRSSEHSVPKLGSFDRKSCWKWNVQLQWKPDKLP